MLFKRMREKQIEKIIDRVSRRDLLVRYTLLLAGCFIVAFAFNLFFLQFNIVCFGISGLSIVLNQYGVDPTTFILIADIVLLVVSCITLGFEKTKSSIVGSLLFPVMVSLTAPLIKYVDISGVEMIVIAVFGAVLSGLGYGLIFKAGFTTGGTDIINQVLAKYTKTSIGKAMLRVDGLVVLSGKLVFSWEIVLYGFIVLYIISMLTDKVVLGISKSKAFYVVTSKENECREFLLSVTNGGVTLINAHGGYSDDKKVMLMGVVPTREYFVVKEGLKEIDKDVFFLVCDAYEVSGRKEKETDDEV